MTPNEAQLLRQINDRTIRLETTLVGDDGFVERTTARLNSHTQRLSRLENWRWFLAGMGTLLALLIGAHMIVTKGI
jgi:hypothetical protein